MVGQINLSIQQITLLVIIGFSVFLSIKKIFLNKDFDEAVEPIISSASTIITFFIMLFYYEEFDVLALNILNKFEKGVYIRNSYIHIGLIVIMFCLIKLLLNIIFRLLNMYSVKNVLQKIKEKKSILFILSVVFGIIRGMVLIILITIPLILFNNINEGTRRIGFFDDFKFYQKMETFIDAKKVRTISTGIIQQADNREANTIVYYNGVTIEEGVKSNEAIDEKAKEITKRCKEDRDKAEKLYKWVGSNITYDDEKAARVVEDSKKVKSGAIITFKDKKGICFDYACLYTAMSKAVGLKSRVVVGQAYNGDEFISHAWNEVYLEGEGRWVNVDCTFYSSGNYFDNEDFEKEHIKSSVAGEF